LKNENEIYENSIVAYKPSNYTIVRPYVFHKVRITIQRLFNMLMQTKQRGTWKSLV
jgi:hypothetical protein